MDFLKRFAGSDVDTESMQSGHNTVATDAGTKNVTTDMAGKPQGSGGFMSKMNNMMGGGAAGEAKEDGLDKAVDWVQEHVLGEGPQNNESAVEEEKDEMISDAIRREFKSVTGHDIPIKDK